MSDSQKREILLSNFSHYFPNETPVDGTLGQLLEQVVTLHKQIGNIGKLKLHKMHRRENGKLSGTSNFAGRQCMELPRSLWHPKMVSNYELNSKKSWWVDSEKQLNTFIPSGVSGDYFPSPKTDKEWEWFAQFIGKDYRPEVTECVDKTNPWYYCVLSIDTRNNQVVNGYHQKPFTQRSGIAW